MILFFLRAFFFHDKNKFFSRFSRFFIFYLSDSSTCLGKIPNVDGVYFTSLQHMSRKSLFSFFFLFYFSFYRYKNIDKNYVEKRERKTDYLNFLLVLIFTM